MFIENQQYKRVWKVETQNGIKKINIGDSKKNKDGSYTNWTWFGCACFGKAKDVEVNEGDTITVISGQITQDKDKTGKYHTNVTIFDMVVTKQSDKVQDEPVQGEYSSEFEQLDYDEDIPF